MASVLYQAEGVVDHNGDLVSTQVVVEDGTVKTLTPGAGYYKKVDVKGYILPAFVDAHLHLKGLGASLYGVDLRGSRSAREVAERLGKARGPVAFGRGWDQEAFTEPGLPDRRLLDNAVGDRPGVAVRVCGHMAVANTRALEETKPWLRYPDQVDREKGILVEDAVYYVVNKLLERLDEKTLVEEAARALADAGIAGASSMACSDGEIRALLELDSRGSLPIRVACYANRENYTRYLGRGARRFRVVGLKLFADGSLGARTAALSRDYADDPGNRGRLLMDYKMIAALGGDVLARGGRIAVHAIGDRALAEVVEAYRILEPRLRGRIEHASIAPPSLVGEIAGLHVYTVVQPRFRLSDWWLEKRLGDLAVHAYPFKTMRDAGVRLAFSTDAPVEDYRPWLTFQVAMGDCGGRPCSGGESLGPREAVAYYTVEAARASGGPVEGLGRLEPGAPAALAYTGSSPLEKGWRGPLRKLDYSGV